MKLFGKTIGPKARAAEARQQRDAKNGRAMAITIGLLSESDEPEPGTGYLAPVDHSEIDLINRVLTTAQSREWSRTLHGGTRQDYRADEITADLYRRMGAATAVDANPEFAPLLAGELETVESAIQALEANYLYRSEDRYIVAAGRDLLNDLHIRQGHTGAIQWLGAVPVFRPAQH